MRQSLIARVPAHKVVRFVLACATMLLPVAFPLNARFGLSQTWLRSAGHEQGTVHSRAWHTQVSRNLTQEIWKGT